MQNCCMMFHFKSIFRAFQLTCFIPSTGIPQPPSPKPLNFVFFKDEQFIFKGDGDKESQHEQKDDSYQEQREEEEDTQQQQQQEEDGYQEQQTEEGENHRSV